LGHSKRKGVCGFPAGKIIMTVRKKFVILIMDLTLDK